MPSPRTTGVSTRPIVLVVTMGLIALGAVALVSQPVEAIPGPTPGPGQVAITFDDGPAPATGPILDILAARGVPATFFVLGSAIGSDRGRALVDRMHREGHSVQNHTFRHPELTRLPCDAIAREIASTSWAVERVTGVPTSCFRPPYGATSPRVRANALGHHEIMWTADSRDFRQPGVGSIVANSLRGADGRGMIVLLHDGGGSRHQTVAALPFIIDAYAARGYEFVNLCRDVPRNSTLPNGAGPAAVTQVGTPLGLEPLPPTRLFDSRIDGRRVAAGSSTAIELSEPVPADADAVIVQITAVDPAGPGWLGAHRCGAGPPSTSSLNIDPSVTARGGTTVAPVVDGRICIHTSTEAHVLVDVSAALVPGRGSGLRPESPTRQFDSRGTGAPLPSGTESRLGLTGRAGVLVNVTATDIVEPGFVTAWPCEQARPDTSILNQAPGPEAVASSTILPVGADGRLCLVNDGATALIVDLVAGIASDDDPTGGWFQLVEPVRLLDTRDGTGGWSGFLLPDTRIELITALPGGATALVTVTATDSDGAGHLIVWDGSDPMPLTSALNHDGVDIANLAGVTLDAAGGFAIQAEGIGSAHVLVDLWGWFAAS